MTAFRWRPGLEREVVVPVLVIGSLVVSVAVSVAIGVERPYPGVALGSGLLLELERAVAVWAIVLLTLVVGDQALGGRLPDEISGRGVRYVADEQLGEVTDGGRDALDRIRALETAIKTIDERVGAIETHS